MKSLSMNFLYCYGDPCCILNIVSVHNFKKSYTDLKDTVTELCRPTRCCHISFYNIKKKLH